MNTTLSLAKASLNVLAEVSFQTKPEIALALIDEARAWVAPFGLVMLAYSVLVHHRHTQVSLS